jgi:small subunit ribosomal protein S16
MLKIRLSMGGVRKRPVYKIVIADSRYPRDGKFIEKIGSYNPLLPKDKKERIKVEAERVKYWMSKGAQPTLRVSRILGEAQIMPMPKPGNNPQKAVPKKERKKEGEEAKEAPKAEAKKEEPKKEAPKAEAKKEEPKKEEPKAEAKKEEPKAEAKKEEPKAEAKKEEPKKEEPKAEAKKEEPKKEEPKKEEPKA